MSDGTNRAAEAATERDIAQLTRLAEDDDPRVRTVAVAAIVRNAPRADAAPVWMRAAADPDSGVRRRAAEVAPRLGRSARTATLLTLLGDPDAWVAEAAAFAIGEHPRPTPRAIEALRAAASGHEDPLVREAAVAALGSIGDPSTLPVVLAACDDKPAIRRRAVLALAAFDGDEVEARLRAALEDNDWQTRQAAEDLLS